MLNAVILGPACPEMCHSDRELRDRPSHELFWTLVTQNRISHKI
jgi:hypothetical protein